jgi:hypothetical protein
MVSTTGVKGNLRAKSGGTVRYQTRSRVAPLPPKKNHLVPPPVGEQASRYSANLGARRARTKELNFLKKRAAWFVDYLNQTGSMFLTFFALTSTN